MLVLSRKSNESIVIDGDIKVTILKVSGNRVRLGIEAPPDVAIKRIELPPQGIAVPTEDAGEETLGTTWAAV
jgi:carbon storage regulator